MATDLAAAAHKLMQDMSKGAKSDFKYSEPARILANYAKALENDVKQLRSFCKANKIKPPF